MGPGTEKITNNFDFLRLSAATMVIFSHCYPLYTGSSTYEPFLKLTGNITMGTFGVIVFFIISGYLIAKSWVNNPKISRFIQNRILRIFPGLIAVSVFTLLLVGPLAYSGSLINYLTSVSTWTYIGMPFTLGMLGSNITGVFASNPYPNAINGSLWTLLPEFKLYLIIMVLGISGLLLRKTPVVVAVLALATLFFTSQLYDMSVLGPIYPLLNIIGLSNWLVPYLPLFFLIGSLFFIYGKKIRYSPIIAFILLAIWVMSFNTGWFYLASIICLPYIVLFLAFAKLPLLNKAGSYGDFSYGLYIYAFPIQQLIALHIKGLPLSAMFFLSMLSIFPFAVLSWHLVESQALKLKNIDIFGKFFLPMVRRASIE